MTTTPSARDVAAAKAVMEEHCLGNDDRFPHGENVEESGCTCSRHTLDMLSAAIATARAEERERLVAEIRRQCIGVLIDPSDVGTHAGWLAERIVTALPTRRAEEESGRG